MLNRLKSEDEGFTLIELLVVILIIGILAAIALPSFLGQQKKGQNADAKSNARNAVSQLESCFADSQTYVGCGEGTATSDLAKAGLPTNGGGVSSGDVGTSGLAINGYVVTAHAKSGCDFVMTKAANAAVAKSVVANGNDCPASW